MTLYDSKEREPPSEKTSLLGNTDEQWSCSEETHKPTRSRSRTKAGGNTLNQSLTGALARSTSITRINSAELVAATESNEKVPSLWSSSRSQLMVLVALFVADIFNFMCLAIMAPFFPKEAESKGMSSAVSGWVFAVFSLIQFAFAPISGKLIPVVGARFLFLSGLFFGGACTILFGFVDQIPVYENNNTTFTVFCFMLRIFLALGSTAGSTATFAIAARTFPDNTSTALGLLETGIGIGLMAGPALGGVIYEAGGFIAPFAVVGGAMVVSVFFFYFIIEPDNPKRTQEASVSMLALLKVPVVSLILVTVVVSALLWVGLDPILEPQLRQFNLSPAQIGLVFLLMAGTYALLAPLAGRVADRMDNSTPLMIAGFAILSVGFLLLGPSSLLGLQSYNKLWLNLVALIILGIGVSLTVVPTFDKILTAAEHAGLPDSEGTNAAVAGLWTSVYALGEFIGPVYTGAAFESIGFSWTMTVIAITTMAMFVLTICIYMFERDICFSKTSKLRRYSPFDQEEDKIVTG